MAAFDATVAAVARAPLSHARINAPEAASGVARGSGGRTVVVVGGATVVGGAVVGGAVVAVVVGTAGVDVDGAPPCPCALDPQAAASVTRLHTSTPVGPRRDRTARISSS